MKFDLKGSKIKRRNLPIGVANYKYEQFNKVS